MPPEWNLQGKGLGGKGGKGGRGYKAYKSYDPDPNTCSAPNGDAGRYDSSVRKRSKQGKHSQTRRIKGKIKIQ